MVAAKRKKKVAQVEAQKAENSLPQTKPISNIPIAAENLNSMQGFSLLNKIQPKKSPSVPTSPPNQSSNHAPNLSQAETPAMGSFQDLKVDSWLIQQLKSIGITHPTEIQSNSFHPILSGKNCIGCAKTGSGKTAAFALPILQLLSKDPFGIHTLVLTPTRELAFQIADQFEVLGKPIHLRVTVVVGGMDMLKQAKTLSEKPHIVIATPGRLADLLASNSDLSLNKIRFLVLDEADRLMEDSFAQDLKEIVSRIPNKRSTLMFSATLTQDLFHFDQMKDCFHYEVKSSEKTVKQLDQKYIFLPQHVKECYLIHLLETLEMKSLIIFVGKCRSCAILCWILKELNINCVPLHSQLSQAERLASIARFRSGVSKILITTDVASRGLDIPTVDYVVNFDLASCDKNYIHRVGRTARAGRKGTSISFVSQYDIQLLQHIEEKIGVQMTEFPICEETVLKSLQRVTEAKRTALMKIHDTKFGEKRRKNMEKWNQIKKLKSVQ